MNDREALKRLLIARSLKLGSFVLASGAHSEYYIDARRTTMTAEGQDLIGKVFMDLVEDRGLTPTHVGGMTLGADPIAYAIAHESYARGRPIDGFTIRKEPKGHGTGQQVEGGLPEEADVLVIEDVITTGGSTIKAIDALRAHGIGAFRGVFALLDREGGGSERIAEQGIEVTSLFTASELLAAAK